MCPNTATAVVGVTAGVDNDGKCIIDYSPFKKIFKAVALKDFLPFVFGFSRGVLW